MGIFVLLQEHNHTRFQLFLTKEPSVRVRGTHKPHSDLDLVVIGATRLAVPRLGLLQEAFRDSTLPFRVDVLDWHAIPASFHTVIDAGYETI